MSASAPHLCPAPGEQMLHDSYKTLAQCRLEITYLFADAAHPGAASVVLYIDFGSKRLCTTRTYGDIGSRAHLAKTATNPLYPVLP